MTAVLLDLTRLGSRLGRGLSGVDRVELAYAAHAHRVKTETFGLARTRYGELLLDREGVGAILRLAQGSLNLATPDLLSSLPPRRHPSVEAAETSLRRLAVGRSTRVGLPRLLLRNLPDGFVYLNIGNGVLIEQRLRRVRVGGAGSIFTLLHDVLPLEHPEWCGANAPGTAWKRLRAVAKHADGIVFPTRDSQTRAEPFLAKAGAQAPTTAIHLGPSLPVCTSAEPVEPAEASDCFLVIGTIEPRKNHRLLLKVWRKMRAADVAALPELLIAGRPGWGHEPILAEITSAQADGLPIHYFPNLSDQALSARLRGARALLCPSLAEGFGLPPLEAAHAGVPAVCTPLAVTREVLGDRPIYADGDDPDTWLKVILDLRSQGAVRSRGTETGIGPLPTWDAHFAAVAKHLNVPL